MMNSKDKKGQMSIVITVLVLLVIGFIILLVLNNGEDEKANSTSNTGNAVQSDSAVSAGTKTYDVEITSSEFSPSNLEINKGDGVRWTNKGSAGSWPASAMHPTHTVYSGVSNYEDGNSFKGSKACVSEGQAKEGAFDSCKTLKRGESWSFTFNQIGSWGYHDHVQSGRYGKIVVK